MRKTRPTLVSENKRRKFASEKNMITVLLLNCYWLGEWRWWFCICTCLLFLHCWCPLRYMWYFRKAKEKSKIIIPEYADFNQKLKSVIWIEHVSIVYSLYIIKPKNVVFVVTSLSGCGFCFGMWYVGHSVLCSMWWHRFCIALLFPNYKWSLTIRTFDTSFSPWLCGI